MPRLELNPTGVRAEMLEGLDRSFPGWGGDPAYRWYFDRGVGPRADLLVLRRRDGGIVAATGINYRRVAQDEDGAAVLGGILTSSWTAPERQGRGLFSRLVEAAARRIRERQGALLLAFVTEDNPSCHVLSKGGCALVPSYYLFSTDATPRPRTAPEHTVVEPTPSILQTIREQASLERRGHLGFRYDGAAEWESQFLRRPHPVEVLAFEGGGWALVESVPASDRVQLLTAGEDPGPALRALLARALGRGRQLFLFAASARLAQASRGLGLVVKPGRIAVRRVGDGSGELRDSDRWHLCSGDRM